MFLQGSCRAYIDALATAYAYSVIQSSVSCRSDDSVKASVYGRNRSYSLNVVADAYAPSAENAAVRVSLNGNAVIHIHCCILSYSFLIFLIVAEVNVQHIGKCLQLAM